MKKILFIYALLLLALSGCYEDKGNYDYVKLGEIEIKGIDEKKTYDMTLGEVFTMPEPEIVFADSTQAHNDLSYRWRVDNKEVSTEKNLNVLLSLKPNSLGYWCDFAVKDERTGISYLKKFKVMVLAPYDNGWVWLAENNGKTEMNMHGFQAKKYVQDIFAKTNGMDLPLNTWGLVEHFSQVGYNWYYALQVMGENAVEVNKSDLTKEAWLSEEFVGGLPAGFKPAMSGFTKNYSCVIGQDGQLYVRHSPGGYLYEGRYPSVPFSGSYKLAPMVVTNTPPAYNIMLFFDELQQRYMFLNNGILQGFDELEDAGKQFQVTGMGKKPVYMTPLSQSGNTSKFYAIVKSDAGEYFEQIFDFTYDGTQAALKTVSENSFPMALNDKSCFTIIYPQRDLYIGHGQEMYIYEVGSGDTPVVFDYDFGGGDVVALANFYWTGDLGVMVQKENTHDFHWFLEGLSLKKVVPDVPGKVKTMIFKLGPYGGFYSYL